jgi:ATP-dependent Lon protease
MYKGHWDLDTKYERGDIIYTIREDEYYICALEHVSNNVTHPVKEEDVYWIYITESFVKKLTRQSSECSKSDSAVILPMKESKENFKQRRVKRKLSMIEDELEEYKRQKVDVDMDLFDQLLLSKLDICTKSFVIDKYKNVNVMNGADYSKGMTWLKTINTIPFGKYKSLEVKNTDSKEQLKEYFKKLREKLDENVEGLDEVKQEILEFVARKITNPKGKGHILALCGPPGVGKSKLARSMANALDLPFCQINCGGINDVSVLTGHSETYVGSKPGKVVEALQNAKYMNPIIFLDEIDKISENKFNELNGVFTHMLDEEQNCVFQDNYLSNIPIDLSQVLFVIALNDITKLDEIVKDRMKIIYIKKPTLEEKVKICQEKILPEIINTINFKDACINIDKEVIEYIALHKCESESGVRKLKKTLEKVLNTINYDILIANTDKLYPVQTNKITTYNVTCSYVDLIIKNTSRNDFNMMYV